MRPTADTDIHRWEKTSVFICVPRSGHQIHQWFTNGVEEIHHRTHRTAYRPSQNTQKVLGREMLGFQCILCAVADGFSVFSGQNPNEKAFERNNR